MKKQQGVITKIILFVVLYVVIYIAAHDLLFLQEQFQFFQNDSHYIADNLGYATGPTQMLSEFIVQFYHYDWLGVLLATLLLMAAIYSLKFLLVSLSTKEPSASGKDIALLLFAFAPTLLFLHPLITGDGTLPIVQFTIACAVTGGILRITPKWSWLVATIAAPILFYLCGAVAMLLPIFIIIGAIAKGEKRTILLSLIPAVVYALFGLIGIRTSFIGSLQEFITYKAGKAVLYHKRDFETAVPVAWYITIAISIIYLLSFKFLHAKRHLCTIGCALVVLSGLSILLLPAKHFAEDVTFMEYRNWAKIHHLYVSEKYDKILDRYKERVPEDIFVYNYLNLALYRTDRLTTDYFEYNIPENEHFALLAQWIDIPFPCPFLSAEVYYEMGIIASAQRSRFEENIFVGPRGAAPSIKFLTEIEILRGNYKTADKYLTALENTIFYRRWAKEERQFLNDDAVKNDPYLSAKRGCLIKSAKVLPQTDELAIMQTLSAVNPAHKSTIDFCGMMILARGYRGPFRDYITILFQNNIRPPYSKLFEDGILNVYRRFEPAWEFYKISEDRIEKFREFMADYDALEDPLQDEAFLKKYNHSYWLYYYIRSKMTADMIERLYGGGATEENQPADSSATQPAEGPATQPESVENSES